MIEYSDDPESRSLFKTRGRHMVSKVLMQACRTFGLEEYYDRCVCCTPYPHVTDD